jgi:hypothetical protein
LDDSITFTTPLLSLQAHDSSATLHEVVLPPTAAVIVMHPLRCLTVLAIQPSLTTIDPMVRLTTAPYEKYRLMLLSTLCISAFVPPRIDDMS